jgi:hypothetical protein
MDWTDLNQDSNGWQGVVQFGSGPTGSKQCGEFCDYLNTS